MLEFELRQGLIADEFELYYQPIVRLHDRQVSGFEEYEERLRLLRNKQMRGGATLDFSLCGLDEERK